MTTKKVVRFFKGKNRVTLISCPPPGDTNPSDAAVENVFCSWIKKTLTKIKQTQLQNNKHKNTSKNIENTQKHAKLWTSALCSQMIDSHDVS